MLNASSVPQALCPQRGPYSVIAAVLLRQAINPSFGAWGLLSSNARALEGAVFAFSSGYFCWETGGVREPCTDIKGIGAFCSVMLTFLFELMMVFTRSYTWKICV